MSELYAGRQDVAIVHCFQLLATALRLSMISVIDTAVDNVIPAAVFVLSSADGATGKPLLHFNINFQNRSPWTA